MLLFQYPSPSQVRCLPLPHPPGPNESRRRRIADFLLLVSCLSLTIGAPVFAELRTVTGEGEHRMSDHDTKLEAEHLALEAAQRNALEQVATYLESVTVVRDLDITADEIRTYTAGLLLILDRESITRVEDNTVIVHVAVVAQVDSDQVIQAIAALRENEDARQQLWALRGDLDQLQAELAEANERLASATDPDQVRALTQQRQELLDETRSNTLLSQAWTGWTMGGAGVPMAVGVPYLLPPPALLVQAWQLAPWSPHVQTAQQTIMPQQPLPRYARPPHTQTTSQARLRSAIRPWSGTPSTPRAYRYQPHSYNRPGPSYRTRPANPRSFAPQGSRGPRGSGGGRGRR